jgi:thiamine-phosphate pyrophosphorylase
MLITDGGELRVSGRLVSCVEKALRGGQGQILYLQLREQVTDSTNNVPASDFELKELISVLSPICKSFQCKLLINRRVDFLRINGIDGVHLGKNSDPIEDIECLNLNVVVGYSAHSQDEAIEVLNKHSIINYILFGPVFSPISKPKSRSILGVKELKKICLQSSKPVFAVGGINEQNIASCKHAGASGVATIGAIFKSKNPEDAVKRLMEKWVN